MVVRSIIDVQMHRRMNGGVQKRQEGANTIDGFDHVGAGLAEDDQNDARLAVGHAGVANVVDGIDDLADIRQPHRGAVVPGDDERLVFVRFEELIGGVDGPCVAGIGGLALGRFAFALPGPCERFPG